MDPVFLCLSTRQTGIKIEITECMVTLGLGFHKIAAFRPALPPVPCPGFQPTHLFKCPPPLPPGPHETDYFQGLSYSKFMSVAYLYEDAVDMETSPQYSNVNICKIHKKVPDPL